jgi:hypothetical protein
MAKIITIPKNLARKDDLIVLEKSDLEKLTKENLELRVALEAILAGEVSLRKKKTRTFREFLKSEFPKYAKSF